MSSYENSSNYQKQTTKILVSEGKDKEKPNYMVDFSGESDNYCVGFVDIVNSTQISVLLRQEKMSKYYEIFLNSMANIVERFGGFVIKNIGDSLLYYFPESKSSTKFSFLSCIECSLTMIDSHELINTKVKNENLPHLNYRVSADYGKVTIIKSDYSSASDIIGIPVNICSKINPNAPQNGVVIGNDLYQMVKDFDDYNYNQTKAYSVGLEQSYPIYSIKRKKEKL
jgi:class 3 adenylate cyclase